MNVPLSANTYFGNINERQKLKVWSNSKEHIINAPFIPYMYSMKRPIYPCIIEDVKRRLLSDPYNDVNLFKSSFNRSGDVGIYGSDDVCLENHVNFVNRVYIDEPEWITNFTNTDKLKIMSFDCEMETDGTIFPIPAKNSIAGIGYKFVKDINNAGIGGIDSKDIVTMWSSKRGSDLELIIKFLNVIKKLDPDILVGFNSNNFDLKYLRDRCVINRINFNNYIARSDGFGSVKDDDLVRFVDKTNVASNKKYTEVRINGRISYDLHYPVIRDQSMFGIKNRKMKTVAKWYNIPDVVEEDVTNVNKYLDTPEGIAKMDRYLRSDINITDALFSIYFKNSLMLADKLMIPLDDIVNSTPSFISNIIFGRELAIKNIVSDGSVIDRYDPKHVSNKRGGWVETYKKGFIEKLYKLDFKSYYPFIVIQFNISPETCFIVRYEKYNGEMGYNFWWINEDSKGDNVRWFYASIPDSTLGMNVVIKINMSEKGFLPVYMQKLFDERALLKEKMKKIEKEIGKKSAFDDVEYSGLKSRENAVKIIINSFTGYVGNRFALYGNLASYVCITGFGRYFTQKVISKYESIVVSSDTDAIYTDELVTESEINIYVETLLKKIGLSDSKIIMENEGNFGSAYFLDTKGKNYYIHDLDKDVVKKKGVATKRSSMARVIDIASDKIVYELLKGGISTSNVKLINTIDNMYDTSNWNISDISQGIHTRHPSEYKKGNPIGLTIAKLAQKRWKIPDNEISGTQVNYIKLIGKSNYAVVNSSDDISNFNWDVDHYIGMLDTLLDNLCLKSFEPSNRRFIGTEQGSIENAWG